MPGIITPLTDIGLLGTLDTTTLTRMSFMEGRNEALNLNLKQHPKEKLIPITYLATTPTLPITPTPTINITGMESKQ